MPEKFLQEYYSKKECFNIKDIFIEECSENNCKLSNIPKNAIILDGDEIEKCLSDIRDNSADCIIISKNDDNSVDIVVCELSSGKRKRRLIKNKLENSTQHILDVLNKSSFKINKISCCYLGKYQKSKGIIKSKSSHSVKIRNFSKNFIKIQSYNCGFDFKNIK